ncbi:unnamed protein product [Oikopleura dioica]|uniref:Cadherin domain-containing protein n=1 Tax=Oikopleura dioica TaxID=34765 RepID=E4Y588_OIKDI|nr:unnamed protein product [Oikopleura dioica]
MNFKINSILCLLMLFNNAVLAQRLLTCNGEVTKNFEKDLTERIFYTAVIKFYVQQDEIFISATLEECSKRALILFAFSTDEPVFLYAIIPILQKLNNSLSFVNERYQIRAPENWSSSDQAIAQFEAGNSNAGQVSYKIIQKVNEIRIDKKNGRIFLVEAINREKVSSLSFQIEATSETLSARTNVTLELIDLNDNIPLIDDYYRTLNAVESSTLSVLTSLNSSDPDSSMNARIRFTIGKECPGSIGVDYYTGKVQTRGKLDFSSNVNCSIWAYDLGAASIPSKIEFELLPWTNPDKRSTIGFDFPVEEYHVFLKENSAEEKHLLSLPKNTAVKYSLVGEAGRQSFQMRKNQLWTTGSVDREISKTIKLLIAARLGKESRFVEAFIHVLDENDQQPVIQPIGDLFVEEKFTVGMLLYRVEVNDLDETAFFEFSVVKGSKFVSIERFSGFLYLRQFPFQSEKICISVSDGRFNDENCFFLRPANGDSVQFFDREKLTLNSRSLTTSALTVTNGFGETVSDFDVFLNKQPSALELSLPVIPNSTSIFILGSSLSSSRTFAIAHQPAAQTKLIPPADLGRITLSKSWMPFGEILFSFDIGFKRSCRIDENVFVEVEPNELFEAKFSKEGGRMIVFSRGFSVEKAKRIESIEIKVGNERIKVPVEISSLSKLNPIFKIDAANEPTVDFCADSTLITYEAPTIFCQNLRSAKPVVLRDRGVN